MQRKTLFAAALGCLLLSGQKVVHANSAWKIGTWVWSGRFDLDGDGGKENIRLKAFVQPGESADDKQVFRLDVNAQHLYDKGAADVLGFGLAKIHRRDKWKAIIVDSVGYDRNSVDVYRWKNGRLRRLGELIEPTFLGNGLVRCSKDMGFGSFNVLWRLAPQGRFVEVPQQLYPVTYPALGGTTSDRPFVPVLRPLSLHPHPRSGQVSGVLRKPEKIKILATNKNDWFLVRSRSGVRGWVHISQLDSVGGLVWAG